MIQEATCDTFTLVTVGPAQVRELPALEEGTATLVTWKFWLHSADASNVTTTTPRQALVYQQMAKTGSTTFLSVVEELQHKHAFYILTVTR